MSEVQPIQPVGLPAIFDGPSSPQIDQLAKALSSAQADMSGAAMDSRNPAYNSKYSSLGEIIKASKPALGKYGLSILPKITWNGDKLSLRTILLHASGQWLDCGTMEATVSVPPPAPGKQARVSLVQAAGGLITYLRRYSRSAVCQLYSDEDLDGNETGNHALEPAGTDYLPPEPEPEKPFWGPDKRPSDKTRMWLLNKLQAAPGQENWTLLSEWLRHSKLINDSETPQEWPLDKLPSTPTDLEGVRMAMQQWRTQREASEPALDL